MMTLQTRQPEPVFWQVKKLFLFLVGLDQTGDKTMDEDDLYFIANEHLERKSAELKKQSRPGKKRSPMVITTTNLEKVMEEQARKTRKKK